MSLEKYDDSLLIASQLKQTFNQASPTSIHAPPISSQTPQTFSPISSTNVGKNSPLPPTSREGEVTPTMSGEATSESNFDTNKLVTQDDRQFQNTVSFSTKIPGVKDETTESWDCRKYRPFEVKVIVRINNVTGHLMKVRVINI